MCRICWQRSTGNHALSYTAMDADVIVIGAGAAGLMTAYRLSRKGKKVIVLEARARAGGRIQTGATPFSQQVEYGAEFIHGKGKRTTRLMQQAGVHSLS